MRNLKLQISLSILLTLFLFFATPTKAFAVVQSLNGQTGQDQTFQNDTNVTISSLNNVHSLIWQGLLPISRGGTGASAFINGSIPFISNGIFSQDNSNLFWDNTNKRLGIGTSTPTQSLEVNGGTYIKTYLIGGPPNGQGVFNIIGTNPSGPGDGTALIIKGGLSSQNNGGYVDIEGGTGAVGGYTRINGGFGTSGNGGDVLIYGGDGGNGGTIGNANGGGVEFRVGRKSGSGSYGQYKFLNNAQTTFGILDFSLLSGADKTFSFPNNSGTLGLLESNQTWSGLNTFEAGSNSTIYVGSSVKSGCIALGDSDGAGITYITANNGLLTASSTKPSICQ